MVGELYVNFVEYWMWYVDGWWVWYVLMGLVYIDWDGWYVYFGVGRDISLWW